MIEPWASQKASHAALLQGWIYDGRDPGIGLFTACLDAGAPMAFKPGMTICELACCEENWLQLAGATWPEIEFTGIDRRAPNDTSGNVRRIGANALPRSTFAPESFDAIVSLSAVEHFGLGHYGDPEAVDGDSLIMANCHEWLKPGGWMYFDVPYDPTGYRIQRRTECRVYDDKAIEDRLRSKEWRAEADLYKGRECGWKDLWRGYAHARQAGTLIPKPSKAVDPFHYVACVWQRPA